MNRPAQNNQSEDQPPEEGQSIPSEQPARKFKFTWQFVAGFLGWFLVNGLVWLRLLAGREFSLNYWGSSALIFLLNLAILVFLAWMKSTRQIAWGIAAALGVNLIVSLVLGLTLNAFCLVPFFH